MNGSTTDREGSLFRGSTAVLGKKIIQSSPYFSDRDEMFLVIVYLDFTFDL